ncbi:hypothetical protein GOODEAATRI_024938, partial [Goodea atripinnis]
MEFTRASQVATGILLYSSYTMELVDIRDLTLLQLLFEDAPQCVASPAPLPFSFFFKAMVISEVCTQYMLVFMVPSMNCSSPQLAALTQPQTMTLPPPCLTVSTTHLSLYHQLGHHTGLTSSEPNMFIIRPQDMVPIIHVFGLLVFSKLF